MSLSLRTLGQYPLSIATSLAFEGLSDTLEEGKKYPTPPLHHYQEVWVNVRTLIRNIIGSSDRETANSVNVDDLSMALVSEIEIIEAMVKELSQGNVSVHFYYCTYKSIEKLYPKALFRVANTPKQVSYAALENSTISQLMLDKLYAIKGYDTTISPDKPNRSILLSHYPFDLLCYDKFRILDLIESHTGTIKKKHQWNTKLLNGKSLDRIPFDKMTIQLFGDSGGMIKPYPPDYRQKILEIAEKYQWNSLTTKDRIKMTVRLSKEPKLEMLVNDLYR